MIEQQDRLLYVLSTKVQMSWGSFKEACSVLQLPEGAGCAGIEIGADDGMRRELESQALPALRTLEALGHCDSEFVPAGNHIYAAPPVLARLPGPEAAGVLAGQRYPGSRGKLERACEDIGVSLEVSHQPGAHEPGAGSLAPCRVLVRAESDAQLAVLAGLHHLHWIGSPPAWHLLHASLELHAFLGTCRFEDGLSGGDEVFDTGRLRWVPTAGAGVSALLSRRRTPRGGYSYLYRRGSGRAVVDPAWGRYAALWDEQRNVIGYDGTRRALAVPAGVRLPSLLERAVTMCSGLSGKYSRTVNVTGPLAGGVGWLVWQAVPAHYAAIVASKTRQKLLPCTLESDRRPQVASLR